MTVEKSACCVKAVTKGLFVVSTLGQNEQGRVVLALVCFGMFKLIVSARYLN